MIDADVYLFLVFSDLTCNLRNTGKCCFLAEMCCLIVRRQKLKVATKKIFHQQLKMLWVLLVSCSPLKFIPTAIFGGVNIPEVQVFSEDHIKVHPKRMSPEKWLFSGPRPSVTNYH